MNDKDKTLYQIFKTNIITLIILAVTIFVSYNALATARSIAPLQQDIAIIKEVQAHEQEDAKTYATKAEVIISLEAINQRLTRIENKIDALR
jgi:Tfp pilus assembly protein PilO